MTRAPALDIDVVIECGRWPSDAAATVRRAVEEAAKAVKQSCAGRALAVDRIEFSRFITAEIESHPRIELVREELLALPEAEWVVLATGPLTSAPLAAELKALV